MTDRPPLLWLDLECTGLDYASPILELACCLTESVAPYERLDAGMFVSLVAPPRPFHVDDVVLMMHTKNGLWAKLAAEPAQELHDVERRVMAYIGSTVKGSQVTLAGAGVASFDRNVIRGQMSALHKRLTYYCFDVSVVRRFRESIGASIVEPADTHRAEADVEHALEEAREYAMAIEGRVPICELCLRRIEGAMIQTRADPTSRFAHYPECPPKPAPAETEPAAPA